MSRMEWVDAVMAGCMVVAIVALLYLLVPGVPDMLAWVGSRVWLAAP